MWLIIVLVVLVILLLVTNIRVVPQATEFVTCSFSEMRFATRSTNGTLKCRPVSQVV